MSIAGAIDQHTRVFSLEDQRAFAELSGDYNPLHLDSETARRLPYGGTIVHGVHVLLWALNGWAATRRKMFSIRHLSASFRLPLEVGRETTVRSHEASDDCVEFEVTTDAGGVATATLTWRPVDERAITVADSTPEASMPREVGAEHLVAQRGELPLYLSRSHARTLLPELLDAMPEVEIAALAATSRIVGMHCPGLHSLYSDLGFQSSAAAPAGIQFQATAYDSRFRLATVEIFAPTLTGRVKAFLRESPVVQPSCEVVSRVVNPGEFSGQAALVIGGSRGIGEVVAKILACGGADVMLTYHRGAADARRVVDDIAAHGGLARMAPFDVTLDTQKTGVAMSGRPATHLYYMATPPIRKATPGVFSGDLFSHFSHYYVTGFAAALKSAWSPSMRGALYPSTAFIDEPPPAMTEYVAAKAAGEALCASLERSMPSLRISRPRLPKIATDQTMSMTPVERADALPVILGVLRSFCTEA